MIKPPKVANKIVSNFRRIAKNNKIAICCSGGADSMALLFFAIHLKYDVFVIHAVHNMRETTESLKDRDLVKNFCEQRNIKFCEISVCLEDNKTEENYRNLRYQKIINACYENGYSLAATGHNADDQLETLIMKMCRGTGLKGLSGIAEFVYKFNDKKSVKFIRPLLNTTKKDIYSICDQNKIPYNEDASNLDINYTRNKIRQQVVPVLKELFPNASENSVHLSKIVFQSEKAISNAVKLLSCYETRTNNSVSIPKHYLSTNEKIIVSKWLSEKYFYLTNKHANYILIENISDAIKNCITKKFHLQNIIVCISRSEVLIKKVSVQEKIFSHQKEIFK